MRDDFSNKTKETIAKRVNFLCSNPNCKKHTTGPSEVESKSVNVGVASHISAASKGGCRYDSSMSSEERKSVKNGISLCQTCSKLIDSDEIRYTTEILQNWKSEAENFAQKAISNANHNYSEVTEERTQILNKLKGQMLELFSEMSNDLSQYPFRREFIVMSKEWGYWAKGNEFVYYFEEHSELRGKLQVLQNYGFIKEITYNNAERFIILEELAEYLMT
jgi:hypothetical protein